MEGEKEDTYTFGEKILHYLSGHRCRHHWTAIKAASIVFKGGAPVLKLPPHEQVRNGGKDFVCLPWHSYQWIEPHHIQQWLEDFSHRLILSQGQRNESRSSLQFYLDSRCKMRGQIIQHLPAKFVSMRSGEGFPNTCNNFCRDWQPTFSHDKRDQELLPEHNEFWKLPSFYLLTINTLGQTHIWLRWWLTSLIMPMMPPNRGYPWSKRLRLQSLSRSFQQRRCQQDCNNRKLHVILRWQQQGTQKGPDEWYLGKSAGCQSHGTNKQCCNLDGKDWRVGEHLELAWQDLLNNWWVGIQEESLITFGSVAKSRIVSKDVEVIAFYDSSDNGWLCREE